jgi:hypothetical protein
MKTTLTSLLVAMFSLGTVTGLLVGLSQSPVVGVLLPLLFSLLGGAGGFFVLKTDFSEPAPQRSLLVYSLCLLSIAIGTGSGLYLGMYQKGARTSWSLLGADEAGFIPGDTSNEEALSWVLLDARLHLLGLSREQRLSLMRRIQYEPTLIRDLDINSELSSAIGDLESALPEQGVVERRDEWIAALSAAQVLNELVSVLPQDSRPHFLGPALEELQGQLLFLEDDADDQAYLKTKPEAARAVASAKASIAKTRVFVSGSRSHVIRMNEQLGLFLQQQSNALNRLSPGGISRGLANARGAGSTIDS